LLKRVDHEMSLQSVMALGSAVSGRCFVNRLIASQN
jgi:hypothetical protein